MKIHVSLLNTKVDSIHRYLIYTCMLIISTGYCISFIAIYIVYIYLRLNHLNEVYLNKNIK